MSGVQAELIVHGVPGMLPGGAVLAANGGLVIDRQAALVAYNDFRQAYPEYFVNPPDTAFEMVSDSDLQETAGAALIY